MALKQALPESELTLPKPTKTFQHLVRKHTDHITVHILEGIKFMLLCRH